MRGGRSGLLIRDVVFLLSYCSATCSGWQQQLGKFFFVISRAWKTTKVTYSSWLKIGKEIRFLSSQLQKEDVTKEQYNAMMNAYSQMIMAPASKQKTDLVCAKQVLDHGVWKSQKKSHSTLRAKRVTFTFWVDKSSIKMPFRRVLIT